MSAIRAARVAIPAGMIGPSVISFADDGRIARIEPAVGPVSDWTLAPGFVDVQVNGIEDIDVAHAEGSDWERLSSLLLDQGTTAWCPTLVTAPLDRYSARLTRIGRAMHDARQDQSTILGAHLEGPFLGGAPGAHPRSQIIPVDHRWLTALAPFVRLVTIAAENPGAAEAVRTLTERGVVVSIGHSTPTDDQVDACVEAGATMVTHLFNGMSGVHHRSGGLALRALDDERLVAGLIADGVHVGERAIRLAVRAKGASRIALVTDSVGWRRGSAGEIRMQLIDGAPRLADGTLAGSALTMDAAIRYVVDRCGISVHDAITMASTTPARVIRESCRGELRSGAIGDVVALAPDLTIAGVWKAGRRVR